MTLFTGYSYYVEVKLAPRPLAGGPLAIDLLNTRWGPKGELFDWLQEQGAPQEFAASRDVAIASADIESNRTALTHMRQLIQHVVEATLAGTVDRQLANDVDAALAQSRPNVTLSDGGLSLGVASKDPARQLATDALVNAIELLSERPDRIRSCQHDECTLWFFDSSKAGRRRWCSMARCGNRAKARRHRETAAANDINTSL